MDLDDFQLRTKFYEEMVAEYWRIRKGMEDTLQAISVETRELLAESVIEVVSLGEEHGVTNAQLTAVLNERTDGYYRTQYRSLPYDLAKARELVGTKERRLNKAGHVSEQRVWYLPEHAPDEGEEE